MTEEIINNISKYNTSKIEVYIFFSDTDSSESSSLGTVAIYNIYLDTFCFVMHCDIKDTKKWALFEAFFVGSNISSGYFRRSGGGSVVYGVYLQY